LASASVPVPVPVPVRISASGETASLGKTRAAMSDTNERRLPTDRNVFQNAWVVPDLDAAMPRWSEQMGIGPFFVMVLDELLDVTYRGAEGELAMRVGLAQAGPVQIELIELLAESPCAYRDSVPAGEFGFHHMCVWTHDIDADTEYFARLGYPAATAARTARSRFAYYDTRPLLGCMLEVVEYSPETDGLFQRIAAAGAEWDGRDPVRSIRDL